MDLAEAKQELATWRQLSFHIDKALDALDGSRSPETDPHLSQVWEESIGEEQQRLRAMRAVSPNLQYLALRGERMLGKLEYEATVLKYPPWWQFWRRKDRRKAKTIAKKAKALCKNILREGRRMLRKSTPINEGLDPHALSTVHRTPSFLHHPELFATMHHLAVARHQVQLLDDPEAKEEVELLYQQMADLLHQRDQFTLEEKLQALARIEEYCRSLTIRGLNLNDL
jgi:hypothetical protein